MTSEGPVTVGFASICLSFYDKKQFLLLLAPLHPLTPLPLLYEANVATIMSIIVLCETDVAAALAFILPYGAGVAASMPLQGWQYEAYIVAIPPSVFTSMPGGQVVKTDSHPKPTRHPRGPN